MIASGLLRLQRSAQHPVWSLCHDSPEGFTRSEAIWLETTTFRQMFMGACFCCCHIASCWLQHWQQSYENNELGHKFPLASNFLIEMFRWCLSVLASTGPQRVFLCKTRQKVDKWSLSWCAGMSYVPADPPLSRQEESLGEPEAELRPEQSH